MTITEYVDAINCNIKITYYHNQDNRWCASFEHAEIKDYKGSGILASTHGNGKTPNNALLDYLTQIAGKTLVFNATGGDKRREYKVPMDIMI